MKLLEIRNKHIKPPKWAGCWRCGNCDSAVLLEEGDEDRVVMDYDQKEREDLVWFNCPHCGQCQVTKDNNHGPLDFQKLNTPCAGTSTRCDGLLATDYIQSGRTDRT